MIGDTAPKRWRFAVDALAFLTAVSLLLAGWAAYTRFSDTNHTRIREAATWRAVICSIEKAVIEDKTIPHERKVFALRFYDRLLVENVHTQPCGYINHLGR